jgi:hypothetical protein
MNPATSGERPDYRGRSPHARQPALHLPALVRRIEVANDGHRHRLNRPGAEPLDQPEGDQRRHRPGEAAADRAGEEDGDADQQHVLAAVKVGQLAEQHGRGALRQQE